MTTPSGRSPASAASPGWQTSTPRFRHERMRSRMRTLNRAVLMGCAVLAPLYLAIRLTGGSTKKLEILPDLMDRLKTPIVWEVPEGGVRYTRFFHAPPAAGYKFVLVRVHMAARMKIGYPVVPRCFELLDDGGVHYYPMSRSPMFIRRGVEFYLDRDDDLDEELLFEIPETASAERLTFERYQPPSE